MPIEHHPYPSDFNKIVTAAKKIENRMEELKLNAKQLAAKCEEKEKELYPDKLPKNWYNRIRRILMNAEPNPKESRAKVILPKEGKIISLALEKDRNWLIGKKGTPLISYDPLINPEVNKEFKQLLFKYWGDSKELIGWADFLPCSLETKEFMHAHHEALFNELDQWEEEEKQKIVEAYDNIGSPCKEEGLVISKGSFYHLMFMSDLKNIVYGKKIYKGFSKELRQSCIKNLIELISNNKIYFVIADKNIEGEGRLRKSFGMYDSLVAIDDKFSFWRDCLGSLFITENRDRVRLKLKLLKEFINNAEYNTNEKTKKLLEKLYNEIK